MKKLHKIEDLLSKEEKDKLYKDLAEMAKQRRLAESSSANIPMA